MRMPDLVEFLGGHDFIDRSGLSFLGIATTMAEMISTYSPPSAGPAKHNLNEVSPLTARAD